ATSRPPERPTIRSQLRCRALIPNLFALSWELIVSTADTSGATLVGRSRQQPADRMNRKAEQAALLTLRRDIVVRRVRDCLPPVYSAATISNVPTDRVSRPGVS